MSPPIISIFNKTLDTTTQNIAINTSSTVDDALDDIKKNFFRLNHNINFAKKYLLEHKQDIADNVGGIGEELGNLAGYQLGLIGPEKSEIKTFKFKFNDKSDINLSFDIPSFNIYDTPPGLDIIDYVPDVNTGCDYVDGDIILFPGIPCALPEIAICKKKLTKKILGKRINLGTIEYPCGYKQKTIGGIVLNKSDYSPSVLYSFPGFEFKCVGNIDISGEMTIEMSSGLPIDLFTEILKGFDKDTYNSITNNSKNPITDISIALKMIFQKKPTFQWFLDFAGYAIVYNSRGLNVLHICITSIIINSTTTLKYLSASYGKESLFNINNLSYSEDNYELLQNGRYISASISTSTKINFTIGLGSYQIGRLAKLADDASDNYLGLIIKMINSEKIKTTSSIRLRELNAAFKFLDDQINSEKNQNNPYRIPNFINVLKNIKTKVDLSLSLTIEIKKPSKLSLNAKVYFTFAQIIEFIKQYLADFVVDALLSSADAEMFLINIETQAIELIIKPAKLPDAITSQIGALNKKFDYARNLFKGYITIGIMESTSFLEKIIPNKNTNYSYTLSFPV